MKNCIISLIVNNVAIIEMRPEKVFIWSEQDTDIARMLWSLRRSPIILLTLFNIIFKCSSNDNDYREQYLTIFKNQRGMFFGVSTAIMLCRRYLWKVLEVEL